MGEFLHGQGTVAIITSDGDEHQSFPFGTREGGFRSTVKETYPEVLELMQEEVVTLTLGSGLEMQGRTGLEVLLEKLIYDKNPYRKHLYSEIHVLVKESL